MHCPRITLRQDGPEFSRIVAGMWRLADWNLPLAERIRFIEQCIALGVTTFDHADIYGNYQCQQLFGEALAQAPSLKRQIQLVSKCGIKLVSPHRPEHRIKHYDTSAAHIIASTERTLTELQVDTLDLLLIHRPDPLMDYDEMAGAFERLRADGKVKHFGVSNFTPAQFEALDSRIALATNQLEFSPLHLAPLTDGQFDTLQRHQVAPMIWSALGGGLLFTRTDSANPTHDVLLELAAELGTTPATLVYAWIMQLPCQALPLTGSGRIDVVRDAVAATALQLERQHWYRILSAASGHEVA
ncbi:aldo/keto reductase [Paludibacterium purpuratum]|uniref:Putative oxidoreductase n=1 Tax=Paludibacterium purpuratum TaxID=1144873 RepID=A0A4R7B9J6_9NEIS|nr:aldo/keto reductase [Paludibacterium purpuratum]TDR80257.1 putative oxidoreductase [Paludibacterium purpuratum]